MEGSAATPRADHRATDRRSGSWAYVAPTPNPDLQTHDPPRALRRPRLVEMVLAAGLGALVLAALLVGAAAASFNIQLVLMPDHGSPGTPIRVTGFPDATSACPSVRMFISPSASISSLSDPRLQRLYGKVTYGPGHDPSAGGTTTRVPRFAFTTPAVRPGAYTLYLTCVGSKDGLDELIPGPAYRVDPLPAGATLPPTTTAPSTRGPEGRSDTGLVLGFLGLMAALAATRRTRVPRKAYPNLTSVRSEDPKPKVPS